MGAKKNANKVSVAEVVRTAREGQAKIDSVTDFEKLALDLQLENDVEMLLRDAGYSCDPEIVNRYGQERVEVRMRRATFKVVK